MFDLNTALNTAFTAAIESALTTRLSAIQEEVESLRAIVGIQGEQILDLQARLFESTLVAAQPTPEPDDFDVRVGKAVTDFLETHYQSSIEALFDERIEECLSEALERHENGFDHSASYITSDSLREELDDMLSNADIRIRL
jgi:hypothetical protein